MPALADRPRAAAELVAALGEIEGAGRNLVTTILAGAPFVEFAHYPPDDVRDPRSGAQYYFHAHRGPAESGHIHCFLPHAGAAGLTHVAAVGLDAEGRPARLFATNLWVTADAFTPAEALIPRLAELDWSASAAFPAVGRALTALFALCRADVAALLRRRDLRLARHGARIAPADPLADERLDILATARLDLAATLAHLRRRLGLGDA